ncbi:hypothetical protein TMatcc_001201 [Talaromyces marneffei ATCC 18224]
MTPRRDAQGRFISSENTPDESRQDTSPEGQLQSELANMSGDRASGQEDQQQDAIPDYPGPENVRITTFEIEKAGRSNIKNWKLRMQIFLETQDCWDVVELTEKYQKDPEKVQALFAKKGWKSANGRAKLYILGNIKQDDISTVRDCKLSGEMWAYIRKKYERKTHVDIMMAIQRIVDWKKSAEASMEDSLQQLEQLEAELRDISDGQIKLGELMILNFFLRGLPKDYETITYAIMGSETITRENVLSRLQVQEGILGQKEKVIESANRIRGLKCWNCGKEGHRMSECPEPRSKSDSDETGKQSIRKKSDHRGRKNHRRGRGAREGSGKDKTQVKGKKKPYRGSARKADYDSDSDAGSTTEDSDGERAARVEMVSPDEQALVARSNGKRDVRIEESLEHALVAKQVLVEKSDGQQAVRIRQESLEQALVARSNGKRDVRIEESLEHALVAKISEEHAELIDESVKRVRDTRWVIDGGATCYCTGDIKCFESLDRRYKGRLGTVSKSTKIDGKGLAVIPLENGHCARIRDVMYVPGMKGNLLSTQMLHVDGIYNSHEENGYRFYREDRKTLATGYNIGRTSYLGTVRYQDALLTKSQGQNREFMAFLAQEKQPDWELLHRRFGHAGERRMRRLVKRLGITFKDSKDCEVCIQAKSVKQQNRNAVPKTKKPLERVSVDFWGPYRKGEGKEAYYLSITDDATRFSWIHITDNRRLETVQRILSRWMRRQERELGVFLVNIRLDNAKEFVALKPWAEDLGIDLEFTEFYTPAQNGVAERLNRLLLEIARSLMIGMNIPKVYWPYALEMANFIRNRTVFLKGSKKSPYEALFGEEWKLSKFRVPFCKVWFHIKTDDKLEPRAKEGTLVGFTKSSSQYVILDRQDREHKVTNPIFMEDEYGFLSKESGERGEIETSQQKPFTIGQSIGPMIEFQSNKGAEIPTQVDIENEISHDLIPEVRTTDELIPETPTNHTSIPESSTNPERISIESESTLAPTTTLRRTDRVRKPTQAVLESAATEAIYRRKSRQGRRQEAREAIAIELLLGDDDEFAYNAVKTEGEIPIPQTYEEAVNDPKFGSQWRKAVELEIRNLIRFGTWRFVKRPDHKAVISCKWVFDIKYQADGRIERFKARLVARGFSQQEGLDFEDTFAPVIRLESLRVLFAIAAMYGLTAHLLDATNAFVGSKLDKQIYMEVPKGLPKSLQPRKDEVCELLQSLYGLRQSANLWCHKVKKFVTSIGFKPSTADPGTFINERGTIIALYMDDILVFSKNEKAIELTKEKLKEFHPMKDSGRVNKILGIRITWLDGSIRLDQEFYTIRILEEFDMLESKPQMLPLSPNLNLDEDSPKLSHEAHSQFRHAIGRLTYLAGGTRPDIQRTVNRLSQHLVEPKEIHFKAIKHLLRYLRGTTNYAISYLKGSKDKKLVGYTDAAYGNASNLRSTTGYIFMLAGGPIYWSSRKQPITATSSSEAEYIAAADSAKQAIWLRHFLYSIRKPETYKNGPIPLYIDNTSALKLAGNPVMHSRSKHIMIRYHVIRDFIERDEIKPIHIPGDQMLADSLTKAVNPKILKWFVQELRLRD